MSDPLRLAVVGASGLVGSQVLAACAGRADVHVVAIVRREITVPPTARMEVFVAEPGKWGEVIEALRPTAVISALGTTWKKAGRDEAAFRAVDQALVLAVARAAKAHGTQRFVSVSSVGADAHAKAFYLKVKGETDRELSRIGFGRLDVLRPGLLRGARGGERRIAERLGILMSPLVNPLLGGRWRAYRAIDARKVAEAALYLATRPARGRFVHDNDAILRAARSLPRLVKE
ncbi:NAD(P)H-binding protein [Qipengyuania sediminis]|uniref:NAD(P)H-binding protein n=1 Tax=Qipengyuania sediminis TaxID=1532023 RepID=UPI001059A59D|nr:NAD(P)H-binding protein [Qipengyuania sediminis]